MATSPKALQARLARTKDVDKRILLQFEVIKKTLAINSPESMEHEAVAMLEEYQLLGHDRGIARAQHLLGMTAKKKGDFPKAIEFFTCSIERAQKSKDEALIPESLFCLSVIYLRLGKYRESMDAAVKALSMQEALALHDGAVWTMTHMADVYLMLSDFKSALELGKRAHSIAISSNSRRSMYLAISCLSRIQTDLGNLQEALDLRHEALAMAKELDDPIRIAVSKGALGHLQEQLGNMEEMLSLNQEALTIFQELGDWYGQSVTLCNISGAYTGLGQTDRAEEAAIKAFSLVEGLGKGKLYRRALCAFAWLWEKRGNTEKTKEYLLASFNLLEDKEDLAFNIEALEILIRAFEQEQNLEQALKYSKQLADLRVLLHEEQNNKKLLLLQIRLDVDQLEQERETYKLQAEQAVVASESKAKQLNEAALLLARRRELLLNVRRELSEVAASNMPAAQAKKIQRQIDSELSADEQQNKIDEILRDIEQEYIAKLSSAYPSLSKTEVIVCVFLKLGMRSIDIAKLMMTSERTVESHRLHIRKKMRLASGESVKDALEKLASSAH